MTNPQTPPEDGLPNTGTASTGEPRTKEGDHQNRRPKDHPQGDPATRRPSADSNVDESGRSSSPGGSIESPRSDSDEDSRSRRRDLGP